MANLEGLEGISTATINKIAGLLNRAASLLDDPDEVTQAEVITLGEETQSEFFLVLAYF